MAGYEVSVGRDLLPWLLSGQDGLAKLVETVLDQILEMQASEALEAQLESAAPESVLWRVIGGVSPTRRN